MQPDRKPLPPSAARPRDAAGAVPRTAVPGLGGFARELWRERRLRTKYFAADLFAEPAWDILLDLYASTAEGRKLGVRGACRATCVPPTTALRYVNALVARGLLARRKAGGNGVTVELAAAAWVEMTRLLAETRCRRESIGPAGAAPDREAPPPG
jgi:hypothetical protein